MSTGAWICRRCNTAYPGPPGKGVLCVRCPHCGDMCAPEAIVERWKVEESLAKVQKELDKAREKIAGLESALAYARASKQAATLEETDEPEPIEIKRFIRQRRYWYNKPESPLHGDTIVYDLDRGWMFAVRDDVRHALWRPEMRFIEHEWELVEERVIKVANSTNGDMEGLMS